MAMIRSMSFAIYYGTQEFEDVVDRHAKDMDAKNV